MDNEISELRLVILLVSYSEATFVGDNIKERSAAVVV
jgi:hypothetical protein